MQVKLHQVSKSEKGKKMGGAMMMAKLCPSKGRSSSKKICDTAILKERK